ncbi:hypothetical protein CCACVL1_03839 [Corchorus capsularis]|uniref:EF-hand domain-containing protein n=1 Tax=Corchorus capsularis TaxID=210143 RepID=A0A1R3JX05_COCAP|nr:hypothetical protein CCACVL1_03839 [Corchorus capsularis]
MATPPRVGKSVETRAPPAIVDEQRRLKSSTDKRVHEMLKELQSLRVFETYFGVDVKTGPNEVAHVYDSLFGQFDRNYNGTVDLEEFKAETKQMMVAMANGMGFLPV